MPRTFDIRPSGGSTSRTPERRAPRAQARTSAPTRREAVRPVRTTRSVVPLRVRRKARRKRVFFMILVAVILCIVGCIVVLWQPFLRVNSVVVEGPGSDVLPEFVQSKLMGTRYGVIPRNSIFFIPTADLRAEILNTYPNIEAVSLSASGLTSLSLTTLGRATAFWWCGTSYAGESLGCYETDPQGKIFKEVDAGLAQASTTNEFVVYAQFTREGQASTTALGGTITGAKYIPEMLRFVKTLKSLGANVVAAEIRGDEADLYTAYGTRITYVLGREQQAASLAATAFPSLTLSNNSLLYVDLRFDSKIFFKKREADVGTKGSSR